MHYAGSLPVFASGSFENLRLPRLDQHGHHEQDPQHMEVGLKYCSQSRANLPSNHNLNHKTPRGSRYRIFEVSGSKNHTLMVFGTRDLKYWVLGPSGIGTRITAL